MKKEIYLHTLEDRIIKLINEGLNMNYKMLEAVTREDWDSADIYNSTAEAIDEELGVLCLIKEALY
jgi:hypothetical protein